MKTFWAAIGVAASALVALYGGVAWYYGVPAWSIFSTGVRKGISFVKIPTTSTLFAPTAPSVTTEGASIKLLSITKTTLSDGAARYVLYGKFVTQLTKEGNSLRGEFVVDGDPNASYITVTISPTVEPVLLGRLSKTHQGETVWEEKTIEEVQKAVETNAPAQIWWTLPPVSLQRQDQILADTLDQANEEPQGLRGLQITTRSVGILAN